MKQARLHDDDSASVPAAPATALSRTAAWLGYGGLLPFLFLAPASIVDQNHAPYWAAALFAYGAIILSFIGALHWGFGMTAGALSTASGGDRRDKCLVWSVVPALMAWLALLLAPLLSSLLLIAGFVAHYWQDRRLAADADLPEWYLPLRLRLSAVACFCLALGGLSGFWPHPGHLLPAAWT